ILRDGRRALVNDAQGKIAFGTNDTSRIPEGFAWPSYHFLETVYEITGTMDSVDGVLAIRDATVTPAIRIVPEVLDGALAGPWQGTLSKRIGPTQSAGATRIPVRVAFDGYQPDHQVIPVWDPAGPQLTYALVATGTIANATAALALADGTCAPALSSLG